MNYVRAIVTGLSLFLVIHGYNKGGVPSPSPKPIDPKPIPVVVIPEDDFPKEPIDSTDKAILSKLDGVITKKQHALILARATRDWADLLSRDKSVVDLGQFDSIRVNLFRELLVGTDFIGAYGGKINDVMKELYLSKLSFLKDSTGVTSTAIDSKVRSVLVDYLKGLSWKFNQIYKSL